MQPEQENNTSAQPEETDEAEDAVTAVSWSSSGHEVAQKDSDWYWIVWILAVSIAVAFVFFFDILMAFVVLVAAGTLTLLARTEQTNQNFTIDARGVTVNEQFFPYEVFRGYEIVERKGKDPLLVLSTQAVLNPHIFIHLTPEISIEALDEVLSNFITPVYEGVPFSHRVVEYLGL
ncbi:MAG: hypothetical protein RI911_727 [Candidatus Parcubacteria bacterium]|jgi:hypothetical protein